MNRYTFGTLFLLTFSVLGCSVLEKLNSTTEKRQFTIQKLWVRRTTETQNMLYRKINRMSPIAFKSKNQGDLLIQANALDGLVAYKLESGREVWRTRIQNGAESPAVLHEGKILIGANDGQFYSIEAETGQVLWTFPTRIENLSEPLVVDNFVFFLSGNNTVYALDTQTGKQSWLYSRQDTSNLSVRGGSKPAYRNGTLYVGFSDGSLVALLAATGAVKWEVTLNKNKKFRDLDSNPIVDGDFIYLMGFDNAFYCVKATVGEIVWKSEPGGYGTPLIHGDRVYYASSAGEFIALEKMTGKKIWKYTLAEGLPTSAVFYKGLVVFGESQGALKFLDAGSGRQMGSFEPGKGVFSTPTVNDKKNQIYFISNEANLYALEAAWGQAKPFPYLR